jgi:hypothetical protein
MAANYPRARIIAVSNSNTQRLHIEQQAATRGLRNRDVITGDVNHHAQRSRAPAARGLVDGPVGNPVRARRDAAGTPADEQSLAARHGPESSHAHAHPRAQYGEAQALRWRYWRVCFMSRAELWGYAGGRESLVSHYLFEKR